MMKNIFLENNKYTFQEIVDICNENKLTTIDCLKEENIISVETWNKEDESLGGTCLFEFSRIGSDDFVLKWAI